ncbi:MAG TPA: hypothetical protein VFF29_06500 [Bacteroidota bacterium]|nr:hypothetical protein [Bacteroidota bacterium]
MYETLFTILKTVFIATVSSWITVKLSLRKFQTERWWERKVEAYERIIEALHHTKAFSDAHLDANHEGREVSKERDDELRRRSREAHFEIAKAADMAAFFLSEEAKNRLDRFLVEEREASNTTDWQIYLESDWAATNSCLEDFIKIAKKDLNTNN